MSSLTTFFRKLYPSFNAFSAGIASLIEVSAALIVVATSILAWAVMECTNIVLYLFYNTENMKMNRGWICGIAIAGQVSTALICFASEISNCQTINCMLIYMYIYIYIYIYIYNWASMM